MPVVLLGAVGGVIPLVIAWRFGALGIPRNDDWSFLLASFRFADGGGIDGNDWALMNLVGQLVLALPFNVVFGNRIAPLQVLVAALGVAGLMAVYDLGLHWLTQRRALFAACLVAVGPMWAALAGSFMTDVPTFALSMICLAAGARALSANRFATLWLVVAMAAGFTGFAIRQYAMVAVVALAGAAVWHAPTLGRRRVALIVGLCVATLAAAAVFYLWRLGLPGFGDPPLRAPTRRSVGTGIDRSLRAATLVGLLVTPALLLAGPIRLLATAYRRSPTFTLASAGILTVGFSLWGQGSHRADPAQMISPGNYVRSTGILGTDVIWGIRADLLPGALMTVLALVGIVSAIILLTAGASTVPPVLRSLPTRRRTGSPAKSIAVLALVGFSLACTVPVFFGMPLFDRYLLPVIALMAVSVLDAPVQLRPDLRLNRWTAGVAFAGMTVIGLVFACNSASFDGARWRAAERAAEIVGDRGRIDGGFEWINYTAGRPVSITPERTSAQYCIALVSTPDLQPGWGSIAEPVWGIAGEQGWIIAEQRWPC